MLANLKQEFTSATQLNSRPYSYNAMSKGKQKNHINSFAALSEDSVFNEEKLEEEEEKRTNFNLESRKLNLKDVFEWELNLSTLSKDPSKPNIKLEWQFHYAKNFIVFKLIVENKAEDGRESFTVGRDLLALGFSERGTFADADFCLFWFDLSGQLRLQDALTDGSSKLSLVENKNSFCQFLSSNANYVGSKEKNDQRSQLQDLTTLVDLLRNNHRKFRAGKVDLRSQVDDMQRRPKIEFVFSRPLDTCTQNRYAIDNGTTHVLWFHAKGPLVSFDALRLKDSEHSDNNESSILVTKGMKRVQLLASRLNLRHKKVDKSVNKFSLRMQNYSIPSADTTYACKLFKLPPKFHSRSFHITKFGASILPQSNSHVVHHMELFNCANLNSKERSMLDELYEKTKQVGSRNSGAWTGDCNSATRPIALQACKRVILAWAMGAHPLEYPADVGQLIGGKSYSPYVLLEVHYNNEHMSPDLDADNSGLQFEYTHLMRKFDAGVLEIGLEYTDKNSVPPNLIAPLSGHCVSECTRVGLLHNLDSNRASDNQQGIHVFAAQMHTHLTGVASWTEHFRGGRRIGELQRDDHYSPHFQEIRQLPKPVHVLPGDALVHFCLYDTRTRAKITLGGFATTDEMCVTYLHYYPKVDLEVCKSSVDTRALASHFDKLARYELQPTNGSSKSVALNYDSIEWNPRQARKLLQLYDEAPIAMQCNRSDGGRFSGATWSGMAPAKDLFAELDSRDARSSERLLEYRGANFRRRHLACDA